MKPRGKPPYESGKGVGFLHQGPQGGVLRARVCLHTCRAANADRQLGTRRNNEIQMTRGEGGWWGNQVGEVRRERVGEGEGQAGEDRCTGLVSKCARISSENVDPFGHFFKMQMPICDFWLPPPHPV